MRHLRVVIPLAPGAPYEWQPEVHRRVSDYRARHMERAYRISVGLDPVARTSGTRKGNGSVATPTRPAAGLHTPTDRARALPFDVPRVLPADVGSLIGLAFAGIACGLIWGAVAFVLALWRRDEPHWLFSIAVALLAGGLAIGVTAIVAVAAGEGRAR